MPTLPHEAGLHFLCQNSGTENVCLLIAYFDPAYKAVLRELRPIRSQTVEGFIWEMVLLHLKRWRRFDQN